MLSLGEERPVHWSLLGAGVEGCYRESHPNFDYQPPRQLPRETDLWHRKKKKERKKKKRKKEVKSAEEGDGEIAGHSAKK